MSFTLLTASEYAVQSLAYLLLQLAEGASIGWACRLDAHWAFLACSNGKSRGMLQKTPRKKHRSQAKQQMNLSPKKAPAPITTLSPHGGDAGLSLPSSGSHAPSLGTWSLQPQQGLVVVTLCRLLPPLQALEMHWEPLSTPERET